MHNNKPTVGLLKRKVCQELSKKMIMLLGATKSSM